MKGQGRVYRPKVNGRESRVWWLDYGLRGARHRESSRTTSKREALELLRQHIGKRRDGTLSGRPERVTLAELEKGLQRHYLLADNASWERARAAFVHLAAFLGGATTRAIDITRSRMSEYQEARLKAGAARETIRYETGVLTAAFSVAVKNDLLPAKPIFPRLAEGPARSGFFEPADFAVVVANLPADVADVVRFARMTGWRRGEVTGLLWAAVDWDDEQFPGTHDEPVPGPAACIRIGSADTKGGDAREFPIGHADELRSLLLARWRQRDGLHVFHRAGKPVGDFRKVWARACTAAGVPGRLVHDLRRTAARDFRRAGVSEGVIMRLCGWKTRSMFDRYNVIDPSDLEAGVEKRFQVNGKETANIQAAEEMDE